MPVSTKKESGPAGANSNSSKEKISTLSIPVSTSADIPEFMQELEYQKMVFLSQLGKEDLANWVKYLQGEDRGELYAKALIFITCIAIAAAGIFIFVAFPFF